MLAKGTEFDRGFFAPELVAEMRGWLSDCEWSNVEPGDWWEFPEHVIVRAVERYYEGGVAAFVLATEV